MAATVGDIKKFIGEYPSNWTAHIDEGGLTLVITSPSKSIVSTYEVGGERIEEEDT